jgi:L-ascorbate metabolism protein UlaG (beta-lactamase superfamily)
MTWKGIEITRTEGNHGTGKWLKRMGNVMGFVLRAEDEPTIYWAGDTIWYEAVEQLIETQQPDIIITHSSGALIEENSPIVMDAEQTISLCRKASESKIIAVHMEALDHGTVTREDLRQAALETEITENHLLIPNDGEILNF